MKRTYTVVAALSGALMTLGCGDELGTRDWEARVDTMTLYSLARPELQGLPAAFDFVPPGGRHVVVEALGATGNWDFALSEVGGDFVLLPAGALAGAPETTAALGVVRDRTFEELERAPTDTAFYVSRAPVALESGPVYVVRSHQNPSFSTCLYYAKVELLDLSRAEGRARLAFTKNPRCNDRSLVPPDDD